MKLRLALPLALFCATAFAQDVNWNVVLTASGGSGCLPLQTETINGQPFDLSKGAGMSMQICPWVYINSSDYGYIDIQVPPTQPWAPDGSWYSWYPSPFTTPSQIQRGTPTPTSNVLIFSETDTFTYTVNFEFFQVWVQAWNGTLMRTLELHEKCGRWPCKNYVPIAQCTRANNCTYSFSDLSATAVLTGTFPVPTAP